MLEFRLGGMTCRISLLFPALLTALLLCQPDSLAITCLLASLVHEGGHLLAMLLLHVPPKECTLGLFGLRIRLHQHLTEYIRNMGIALAGPLINGVAAVVLLILDVPQTAAIHILLALLNLLPVAVLDGGEIWRCLLCLWIGEQRAHTVLRLTSALVIFPMIAGGVWLILRQRSNPTLLIIGLYLAVAVFFSDKSEKNS